MKGGSAGSADDVALTATDSGAATLLPVRAQPGARRRGVGGIWNGCLKLSVRVPPEGGRANEELIRLAAELFGLSPSAVTLVRGHSARRKTLRLAVPLEQVRARLAALLGETT
jgi:hypothetical protein